MAPLALPPSSQQTHANFGESNARGTGASLVSTGNETRLVLICSFVCTFIIPHPATRRKLRKEKIEFLNLVKFNGQVFGDVFTKDQLSTIAELLKQEYYVKGATIIREGESGNTFYIMQSGLVQIYKDGINGGNHLASLGKQEVRRVEFIQNGGCILD